MLSIEITTRCNLKCINCFAHDTGEKHSDISYEDAVKILEEGRELGFTELSITGGEPLLWKDLIKLLSYGKSIGYTYFFINTNGHLFNDEICKELSKFGDNLELSCTINGWEDEHDTVRGKGSFLKATAGIEVGLKHGLNIYVYSVVNKRNLNDIPKFTQFIFEEYKGVKSLIFIQLRGIEDDYYNVTHLKLEPNELIEMVKMVSYLSLAGYKVHILENSLATVVAKELDLKWFPESPEISRPGKIVVLQDGTITVNHSSHKSLGIYKTGVLTDVYQSNEYKKLTTDESKLCIGCKFKCKCRNAGKLRPSSKYHNVGDESIFYCQKVLELLK